MTPERWAEAQRLFEAALEQPPLARAAFVAARTSHDRSLATLVAGLLAADAEESSASTTAIGAVVDKAMHELAHSEDDGAQPVRLGPYRIVRRIGEGGMGAVYLAERADDEFHQQVAIKVVRGLLDAERVRRFRAERQILANLEHPHIARLLDGGTTGDGLPYLVMEYVEGEPLDRFCDSRALSIAERLRLFCAVCDGVSHAHRSLVVHRDLKPGNILVTPDGVPKLVDFGIAKLVDESGAGTSQMTAAAVRLLTPDYASPEQVRGLPVTTAADVYALGALLYELLSGVRPHRFRTRSSADVEHVVCEVEPERPSLAALRDTTAPEATRAARAVARAVTERRWRTALAGDLDTIALTALRKEPPRRYASAEAMAADVRRHLAGRPIEARPATWSYTASRFVSRHRWSVAAAAAVLVLLTGSAIALSIQAARLARERDATALERDTARQVSNFLTGIFEVADPSQSRGSTVTARELLDRGADRAATELADQPAVQARLLGTIGNVYRGLGLYDRSAELLERAVTLNESLFGRRHLATAEAIESLAEALREQAQFDRAEGLHREALDIRTELGAPPLDLASSLNDLGLTLSSRGRYDEAESLLRRAVALRRQAAGPRAEQVAGSLNNLALVLRSKGQLRDAAVLLEEAIAIRRENLGPDAPELANVLGQLGQVWNALGDLPRAEPLLREALQIRRTALGEDHPATGTAYNNLASLLHDEGRFADAEGMYRQAYANTRNRLGEGHPDFAVQLNNLASLLDDRGDHAAAEPMFRRSLAIRRATYGQEHPAVARAMNNLARVLVAQGELDEAEPLAAQALAMRRRTLGAESPEIPASITLMAQVSRLRGELAGAASLIGEAVALLRQHQGPRHPGVASALVEAARIHRLQGELATAEREAREAIAIRSSGLPAEHWLTAAAESELGAVLLAAGRPAEAVPVLRHAVEVLRGTLGPDERRVREAAASLAAAEGAPLSAPGAPAR